jgi:hypothetical protein
MVDFTSIEGLTDDQKAKIEDQFNAELSGIKKKNDDLLGEKKTAQQLVADNEQALEDARKLAADTKEQNLKLAGDMDGLKKHYEDQLAESTATANGLAKQAQDALLSRDKNTVLNQALGLIHDDYKSLITDKLSNMLNISYNDEQKAVIEFTDNGNVIASNVEEFKGWAEGQDAFKKILNGVDSSGAGAQQSRGGASGAGNTTEQNLAQRLKAQGININ